jgi:hypothetical protein
MKITIESTEKMVKLNNVPARVWVGESESGIKVIAFITRIAVDENEPRQEEFQRELSETRKPDAEIEAIPLRLIL